MQQISVSKFGMQVSKFGMYIPKFGMEISKSETKKDKNSMANYVIKEMPAGMGNGKKGRTFPKMQIYTEFDYEKVVELIHTNSPLEFADEKAENVAQQETSEPKTKYHHVKVKGVNFKVDKKLIKAINKENTFERTSSNAVSRSPYTPEERQQRALQHIDKHGFITLQDYANLNRLSYSTASRELAKLVLDPHSGIKAKGAGSHKVWVRR